MKYLCIHGHFYQPPRENPWLEAIELQDSAYPYHDWNERITAESYAPNAATRIVDGQGRIERIVNNYSRISFNFGPTVLSWAKDKAPGLHQMILDADRESQELYSGHGSASAQAFNHMIMPLANAADKRTQIAWGIADFRYRFGRDPEGMWLPETAVDNETLDLLAEYGIKFTILAQHQAHLVRRIGGQEWIDVTGARIDPTRAYRITTQSGHKLAIFFYDGPISRAVAFEGLLNNGEVFGKRLLTAYSNDRDWPQLAHIATDGESYGHHHRFGEMALAYALQHIEGDGHAKITNYGEFLELHPPTHEVEIYENTAWSCAHGVGRWMSDCGCNSGGNGGWNQKWRGPLREALDWLRDTVAPKFQTVAARYLRDPWAARNDYISVVLNRSPEVRDAFIARNAIRTLTQAEQVCVWKLLELQRHAMLMYTSCGWFFDELSGIETVQVIQYAGRVVQLAEELFNESNPGIVYAGRRASRSVELDIEEPLEAQFLSRLVNAKSNIPEARDGAHIYEKYVKPTMVNLFKVGAHYAISSLFKPYEENASIYSYTVDRKDYRSADAGKMRLVMGKATFTSQITQEAGRLTFGVLHFGDHNLNGGVREFRSDVEYEKLVQDTAEAFSRADVPEVIRLLDRGFGAESYSLKSLFRDEQRNILSQILISTLDEAEAAYRQLYEHHAPLMRFLGDLKTPLPKAFRTTAEYALNSHLRRAFSADELDGDRIRALIEEARVGGVDLDATTLEFTLRKTIERQAQEFKDNPTSLGALHRLANSVALLSSIPFTVTLWTVQNVCWHLLQSTHPEMKERAASTSEEDKASASEAQEWIEEFGSLAENLRVRLE